MTILGRSIRRASEADLDSIMAILKGRRAWLRETKLSDQWAGVDQSRHLVCFLVRRGHVRVLVDDGGWVLGTVTVETAPDRDFWSAEERRQPALYLSKLATDVECKGQGLGAELLDWTAAFAARKAIPVLRLDTWKTSDGLRNYYATRGWRHVRTVELAHRQSGSLFDREVALPEERPADDEPPTGQFAVSALLHSAMPRAW